MTVVLDTNIVASATFWRGKPARCLEAWALGRYELAVSHPILTEYEEVIARLGRRYPDRQSTDWLGAIRQAAHFYLPDPLVASTADPTVCHVVDGELRRMGGRSWSSWSVVDEPIRG